MCGRFSAWYSVLEPVPLKIRISQRRQGSAITFMRFLGLVLTTIILISIPGAAQIRHRAELSLLEQSRDCALTHLDDLPDFIATQITRRSWLSGGEWHLMDVLEMTISYEHGAGEKTRLVSVNGLPPNQAYRNAPGAKAVGVFSLQWVTLFQPTTHATFAPDGDDWYRERHCRTYRFAVPRPSSTYKLAASLNGKPSQFTIVGYSGRMWLDVETGYPLRIEKVADDIPSDFPISGAETVAEYDWITISGKRFWLPVQSESFVELSSDRRRFLNVTEFRNYRKFDGDVKVVD